MAGTLYVVATPIGNLEDISIRALRTLKEVRLIAAEDTRVTRKLLSHYDIHTPLTTFHQHSREDKTESIIAKLVAGEDVALVADAGMPGISDPGSVLINSAISSTIKVTPIPGPNAALSALVVSGLPTGRFAFFGFPPRTKTDRRTFFYELGRNCATSVIYESPSRLLATLKELYSEIGDRPVAVGRELTKLFEEVVRGRLSFALSHFEENKPRGEFTIVIGPPEKSEEDDSSLDLVTALKCELDSGSSQRDAVQTVSKNLGLPRRFVYQTMIKMADIHK